MIVSQIIHKDIAGSDIEKIVLAAQAKVVPVENSDSVLGVKFNKDGYDKLVNDSEIALDSEQMKDFANVNVLMPCCGYKNTVENYSDNCQCGHHLASYGLIKNMVADEIPRPGIQREIFYWVSYFFPKEAVAKELGKSSLSEKELQNALSYLNSKGGC